MEGLLSTGTMPSSLKKKLKGKASLITDPPEYYVTPDEYSVTCDRHHETNESVNQ